MAILSGQAFWRKGDVKLNAAGQLIILKPPTCINMSLRLMHLLGSGSDVKMRDHVKLRDHYIFALQRLRVHLGSILFPSTLEPTQCLRSLNGSIGDIY